jgi:cytosine/uracil/thiamine/allantoin permease
MKVFLISSIVGIAIAFAAYSVLMSRFQVDSQTAFTTEGARLSTGEAASATN